jgi:hypothetical protein
VQLTGALKAINKDRSTVQQGRDIYTAGVILQQLFVYLFIILTVAFLHSLPVRITKPDIQGARTLTLLLLGVLFLITV